MTDKAKENESLEDIIEYEGPFGMEGDSDTFWDDFEQELKEQILKNKITKVKIYYNVFNPKDIILEDDMQIRGLLIVIKYLAGLLNIGFILRLLDMLFWHQENYL